VRNLKKKLSEADEEARVYNSREALFGKEVTEYSLLKDISKSFEPYCDMWESVDTWLKSYKRWMEVGRVGSGRRRALLGWSVSLPPRRSSG
jgi:dynein heavy chain